MKTPLHLLLLLLIASLLASSCTHTPNKLPDTLYKRWNYVSVTDAQGKPVREVDTSDFLTIFPNKTFEYRLHKEHIHSKGTWSLEKDILSLNYDPADTTLVIDSMVYHSADGQPRADIYHNGKSIAGIGPKGLIIPYKLRSFAITKYGANELVFVENGVTFSFVHHPVIASSSISLRSIGRGLLGVAVLLCLAWLFSTNRRSINWRLVLTGVIIQIAFALAVLKVPLVKICFEQVANFFVMVLDFTRAGSDFLFSGLVSDTNTFGYIFAFQVLPTVIFFSALSSLFYYLGILQKIVFVIAWLMSKTMRLSGAESLSTAANIFLGQTEAPLLVKPYIDNMTRSELLCIMIGGMATIAGGVLAAYVGFLGGPDPEQQKLFATHLLTASIMAAPATIVVSKILLPETEQVNTKLDISKDKIGSNVLEAIANGTTDGLKLAVNVGAMLLVFTALMAMLNFLFKNGIGEWTGLNEKIIAGSGGRYSGLTLQYLLGYLFAPVAWVIGVSPTDMTAVGQLLGEKTILNEFYAYGTLGKLKESGIFTDPKSIVIATYALCGFANFASIGIQIGGIGSLSPGKRTTLSQLGLTALLGGTLACLLTGAIVGMLY